MKKILFLVTAAVFLFALSPYSFGQDYGDKIKQLENTLSALKIEKFKNKPDPKTQWYNYDKEDTAEYVRKNITNFKNKNEFKTKVFEIFDTNDIIVIGGKHTIMSGEIVLMNIIYDYALKTNKKISFFYEFEESLQPDIDEIKEELSHLLSARRNIICKEIYETYNEYSQSTPDNQLRAYMFCKMLEGGINVVMSDLNGIDGEGPNDCCRYYGMCIEDTDISVMSQQGISLRNCNIANHIQNASDAAEKIFFMGGGAHVCQGNTTCTASLTEILKLRHENKKITSIIYAGGAPLEGNNADIYKYCDNCRDTAEKAKDLGYTNENIYALKSPYYAIMPFVPLGRENDPQYLHRPADTLILVPDNLGLKDIAKDLIKP